MHHQSIFKTHSMLRSNASEPHIICLKKHILKFISNPATLHVSLPLTHSWFSKKHLINLTNDEYKMLICIFISLLPWIAHFKNNIRSTCEWCLLLEMGDYARTENTRNINSMMLFWGFAVCSLFRFRVESIFLFHNVISCISLELCIVCMWGNPELSILHLFSISFFLSLPLFTFF